MSAAPQYKLWGYRPDYMTGECRHFFILLAQGNLRHCHGEEKRRRESGAWHSLVIWGEDAGRPSPHDYYGLVPSEAVKS